MAEEWRNVAHLAAFHMSTRLLSRDFPLFLHTNHHLPIEAPPPINIKPIICQSKTPYFSDCSPAWIHPVSKFHHCHYCTFHIILNAKFITPPRAPLPRTALDLRLQPRPPSPGPAIASPQCACPTKPVGINVSQVPLEKLQKQKLGWRDGYVLTLKMSSTAVLFFLSSCPPPKNARSRHVAGPIVPRATASSAVETRRPALARKNTRDVIKNCPRMF